MAKLKALLFDLDGTLRDSRRAIYPSIEHAFATHGLPVPSRDELEQYSHSLRAVHAGFAVPVAYNDFLAAYDAHLMTLLHTIIPYDGAWDMLAELHTEYKIGLVSSARQARRALELDNVLHLFDVVIGGLDTDKHKPDPTPINMALESLQVAPTEAVMVGDLAADIQSAHNAGLRAAIGLTHGFGSRALLETAKADYIIDSLSELLPIFAIIEKYDGS